MVNFNGLCTSHTYLVWHTTWIGYLHYTKAHLVVQGFQLEKFDLIAKLNACLSFYILNRDVHTFCRYPIYVDDTN